MHAGEKEHRKENTEHSISNGDRKHRTGNTEQRAETQKTETLPKHISSHFLSTKIRNKNILLHYVVP